MAENEMNERDAKLVQWLSEAYAKEAELEVDLNAHIALTDKMSYKKRLRAHLTETRDHKRRVASRIKALGGSTPTSGPSVPGVPSAVGEVAGKAVAAVKGQVGTARALVNPQAETHVRNAQEELREEHVEIAIYTRLETLATEVGDRETAQLARSIRRDEERMAKFLDAELKRLVKDVVKAEIPRDQRTTGTRRRSSSRSSSASKRSSSSSGRSSSASKRSSSSSGRSSSASKRSSSSASKRSTSSASKRSTSAAAKRATSAAKRTTASKRSSGSGRSSSSNGRSGSGSRASRSGSSRSGSRS